MAKDGKRQTADPGVPARACVRTRAMDSLVQPGAGESAAELLQMMIVCNSTVPSDTLNPLRHNSFSRCRINLYSIFPRAAWRWAGCVPPPPGAA